MVQDAFSLDFVPTVRVGENLELRKNDTDVLGYYRVKYIEPLPHKVHNFGAISAGSSTGDAEVSDLYMPDGELAAYEITPLDDVEITISQPKAKKRYAAKSYVHYITPLTPAVQARLFMWEDEKVYFDVKNPTRYSRDKLRALYHGWRFVCEKLDVKPPQFTTIPVEGA